MPDNHARQTELQVWLQAQSLVLAQPLSTPLSDASVRRYYRVSSIYGPALAVDAPAEMSQRFIKIATHLAALGLSIPEIYAHHENGFLLISDLGDALYLKQLSDTSADALYQSAFAALYRLQTAADSARLPRYDHRLLNRELALFNTWFLQRHCGLELDADQYTIFMDAYRLLIENSLQQPQVFVHRDYHSRNLLMLAHNSPGILDFQDALRGPVAYDVASLLRDCYIAWPIEQVEAWRENYRQGFNKIGTFRLHAQDFTRWFDFCGLQRHLKAIGIFARLWHQDAKPGYLKDIPRTLAYVMQTSARYAELRGFHDCLNRLELNRYIAS